jgi:hypothetical protein
VNYIANDKAAKKLGVNLKPTQNVSPEDISNISARGFVPDPETITNTDPIRYNKYKTKKVNKNLMSK